MSVNLMLEVGCGTKAKGKQYAFDPKIKADVYVDIEKPEVKIDSFVLADAQFLPFKDKAFINVYASHLIEHLPNPLKFLKEARRVSYGKLYLWLPNKFGKGAHQDPSHLHTFTYFSLKK
ncbi:MAG: class I SAM-dependent methyltransferase, partial [Candidatus Bathyarchaeia archaeon]